MAGRKADRTAPTAPNAEVVYLLGQLRHVLTMPGKRCVLLDAGRGLATHMARSIGKGDVLMEVSFRFYANEVVNIVDEAGQRGTNIIAITDSTLSPLAKWARVLFAVSEHDYSFSRSLAAPMCLAQALVAAVAARSAPDAAMTAAARSIL